MELHDYDTSKRYQASVLRSERITSQNSKQEVRDIFLEVPDFQAHVGQNIGVLAPGQHQIGQDVHFRLYSIADMPETTAEGVQRFSLCVRRCTYIDEFSGEAYPGVASNFLCDLNVGDTLVISGPYDHAFSVPSDLHANMILIGAGTGIAPFRGFIKYLYSHRPDFSGRIVLLHGAQTGMDLLYRNDEKDDFALYYDRETFEAINALSARPGWSDNIDWGSALRQRSEQLSSMLNDPHTHVYVAGLRPILSSLDESLAELFGSKEQWQQQKEKMETEQRWAELLY
jgi:ferredoxin--NADP+ reductase